VVEEGVSGMTLEAVAREAGVSKGGLLYHFPSKEALIGGMIGRLIDRFEAARGSSRRTGAPEVVAGHALTVG
jgi:AcrR family transcriptional regulator